MEPCKECKTTVNVIPVIGYCQSCVTALAAAHSISQKQNLNANKPSAPAASSGFVLNQDIDCKKGGRRTLTVVPALACKLHEHQKDGAKFIYQNCFSDCSYESSDDESTINGCILAHHMGLGKSLTLISVLHTVMTDATLVIKRGDNKTRPRFHMVLLIVPANTLPNWENEVEKWTANLDNPLHTRNLGALAKGYQEKELRRWNDFGGLLLLSDVHFLSVSETIIKNYQPDVLVLDEAHTMLKEPSNKTFKKLQQIKTTRRICLSGTPVQNNLTEYYQMVEFIKPGVFGVKSVKAFEKTFRFPVERGLPSDSTRAEKLMSLEKQIELKNMLEPYVHRKGPKVLLDSLPPLYDTLLELESSRMQKELMRVHRRQQDEDLLSTNFLSSYKVLSPMLNHPGTLKIAKGGCGAKVAWKTERDPWLRTLKCNEYDNLHWPRMSPKLVVLSHILAMAVTRDEKVLVFSQCLKTLDLVEAFLSCRDWGKSIGSLTDHFPKLRLGGWKRNKDYVRLDGSVSSGKRGGLIKDFNETDEVRVFLISSLAGGIGINLCSASVEVMMDNHFNPTVSKQCVSRAHRYGQEKPVRVFRLAITKSLESKVYKRSVNKTGVAMRVLDGIDNGNSFSAVELNDIMKIDDTELTCASCKKRRILPFTQSVPEGEFVCSMNEDPAHRSCSVEEEESFRKKSIPDKPVDENDPYLDHLSKLVNRATSHSPIVKAFAPVEESHGADICCDDSIAMIKGENAGKKRRRSSAANMS